MITQMQNFSKGSADRVNIIDKEIENSLLSITNVNQRMANILSGFNQIDTAIQNINGMIQTEASSMVEIDDRENEMILLVEKLDKLLNDNATISGDMLEIAKRLNKESQYFKT